MWQLAQRQIERLEEETQVNHCICIISKCATRFSLNVNLFSVLMDGGFLRSLEKKCSPTTANDGTPGTQGWLVLNF
jgi:hypothetical protein